MGFYPANMCPPEEVVTSEFVLRPLRATDVDLDYEAVMENPAALRLSGGGSWPADDFTWEANLSDLVLHEKEHKERVAFTYTLMNLGQDRCFGCVYVNQLARTYRLVEAEKLALVDEPEAVVRFWVRQSHVDEGLDWRLLLTLIDWFDDAWRFSKVFLCAHEDDRRQRELMKRADLPVYSMLEMPGRRGYFLAHGPLGG